MDIDFLTGIGALIRLGPVGTDFNPKNRRAKSKRSFSARVKKASKGLVESALPTNAKTNCLSFVQVLS